MKIICSFTSWKQRINNVPKVVFSMLKQSVKPDLIELNLSFEEFINKEKDLPETLLTLIENQVITVNWVKENTKSFKKFIPTVQKHFNEDYYLIVIDDDRLYDTLYIESMIKELGDNDSFCCFNNPVIGLGMIYHSTIFDKDFWEKLTPEMIETGVDDTYIQYYLKYKNAKCKFGNKRILDMLKLFNETAPLHDYYLQNNRVQIAEKLAKEIWK